MPDKAAAHDLELGDIGDLPEVRTAPLAGGVRVPTGRTLSDVLFPEDLKNLELNTLSDEPTTKPYDPRPGQDKVRERIAIWLFVLLAAVSLLTVIAAWTGSSQVDKMMGVLSTVAGLFGAAVGFYFGGRAQEKGPEA